jgi:protein-tyrosine-phosphatase
MAEVLARRIADELGMEGVEVRSAGTHALPGSPASEGARSAAGKHGYGLEGHASTPLSEDLVEWADRILVMSPGHLDTVARLGGREKAALLGSFAAGESQGGGDDGRGVAVPDPFGGDDEVYEETFLTLEKFVELALRRLAGEKGS